jgi:hypothetical protein
MKEPNPEYILIEEIGFDKIKWYVVEYELYNHPDSDWILGETLSQDKKIAMRFINKLKAERVARIINEQVDECGYSSNFRVVELKGNTCPIQVKKNAKTTGI